MLDIKLNQNGDIAVSDCGDISLTESVKQAIQIRLRWIYNEWRLGPEYGFRWFEEVLVKNPNTEKIKRLVKDEIMKVDGVTEAKVTQIEHDTEHRTLKIRYICTADEAAFKGEVTWNV